MRLPRRPCLVSTRLPSLTCAALRPVQLTPGNALKEALGVEAPGHEPLDLIATYRTKDDEQRTQRITLCSKHQGGGKIVSGGRSWVHSLAVRESRRPGLLTCAAGTGHVSRPYPP